MADRPSGVNAGAGPGPADPGRGAAPALDGRDRALVELSAALAAGEEPRLERALAAAAEAAEPVAIEEALLQSYLFLGYPAALEGLARWRRRSGPAGPPEEEADWNAWMRRGEAVCERVYGGQYARLRSNIATLHPEMERWMLAEGYGKVLGRSGLELDTRELCIVAMLAVLGAERQLFSHLRGSLNAGAAPERVEAALEAALVDVAEDRARRAREVWASVRDRAAQS